MIASDTFSDESRAVITRLRKAFADAIESSGGNPAEPQEVSRKFGLDKTLTWRVSRVVGEDDTWEAAAHVPRRPSLQILATALSKHGAPPARIEEFWSAVDAFERFIETHAGDRDTLQIMVSSEPKRGAVKRLELYRKDGYQSNAALWGVSAFAQLAVRVMAPSATPGMVDLGTLAGLVGFKRLRPDVPWAIATWSSWDTQEGVSGAGIAPIDADHFGTHNIPIIPRFCSSPLPAMRSVKEAQNAVRFVLGEGPVGNTASADVFLGWVDRGSVPIKASFAGECGEHGARLTTPAEWLIHDFYVHESLDFAFEPTAHVYGTLPGGPAYPSAESSTALLPVPAEVHELGDHVGLSTPEVARYDEIVDYTIAQMGQKRDQFRGFRFRLRYPPIPALSILRHTLQA